MKMNKKNIIFFSIVLLFGFILNINCCYASTKNKYNKNIPIIELYMAETRLDMFNANEEEVEKEIFVEEKLENEYEDCLKYAYVKSDATILKDIDLSSDVVDNLSEYDILKITKKSDDLAFVYHNDVSGYVELSKIELLDDIFIDVDITNQYLRLISNGEIIMETSVVTGLRNYRDTVMGYYEIYSKEYDRMLTGADYSSHVYYWMPFYGGYGLHDASWRGSFGGEIYRYNGSHGCVNLPPYKAWILYNNVDIGTDIIIHE